MVKNWRFTDGRKRNLPKARKKLKEIISLGKQEYEKRHKPHKH